VVRIAKEFDFHNDVNKMQSDFNGRHSLASPGMGEIICLVDREEHLGDYKEML
jgi:hypothetical protein